MPKNKSISEVLSRSLAYLYVISKAVFERFKRVNNGHVLIIQWGNMGDVLIDAKNILCLAEYYTRAGKIVTLAGTERAKSSFENILGIHKMDFFVVKDDRLTIKSIMKTLSELEKVGYEVIISMIPWSNWPSLYIPACLPCNESWGVFHKQDNRTLKHVLSKFFKNRIEVPIDMQQAQRNKLILQEIGVTDFQTQIVDILRSNTMSVNKEDYIVLSVDSMDTTRRWPLEKFVDLANQLLEEFEFDICLTGNNVEQCALLTYERAFIGNSRVHILIGELDTGEWIETIRNSRFVVSLDSGSVHVAASVGTVCFCLTGVWDGHRILPYVIERKEDNTIEPICIYRKDVNIDELTCYGCFAKRRFGWKNEECSAQCRAGLPCLCLSKITPADVITAIRHAVEIGVIE